jgi:hypothetical protein
VCLDYTDLSIVRVTPLVEEGKLAEHEEDRSLYNGEIIPRSVDWIDRPEMRHCPVWRDSGTVNEPIQDAITTNGA